MYLNMNRVDSTVELPISIHLKDKAVALVDVSGDFFPQNTKRNFYLCCDFIEPSILQGSTSTNVYPILRMVHSERGEDKNKLKIDKIRETYGKLIYVGCNRDEVSNIRLYLIDDDGNLPSFDNCQLKCSLLLIPGRKNGSI